MNNTGYVSSSPSKSRDLSTYQLHNISHYSRHHMLRNIFNKVNSNKFLFLPYKNYYVMCNGGRNDLYYVINTLRA